MAKIIKKIALSIEDSKREKRITARLNLNRLPFKISEDNFCLRYTEMFEDLKPLFKYQERDDSAMKWCFSTAK